jgi:trimeric autotransporter adhesin
VGNPKTLSVTGTVSDGNGGNNYVVTFHPNTGVILARPITVTASSDTRVYDRTTNSSAAPAITLGTLASGDLAGFSQSFDTRHVGTNKTLTPTGAVNDGNGGNDYAVDFVAVHNGDIQPRSVTPVIVAHDKPYDGTTTATLGSKTVTGTITPDVVTLIVGAASFDTKHAGTNKTVTATGLGLGGADASDYQLGATSATDLADISPIALAVAAHGVNKIYDATTTATVTLSATPLSGDVVTLNYSGAAFGDKKVGGGKAVTVSGITTGGTDGGDYTPNTTATTTADITQVPLAVTASGINKVYDATTAAMVTLVVPAFAGDQVTGSYTSAAFGTKSVGTGKTVTVSGIALAGDDAPNYHLQNTGATALADITKRPLTVAASATNKFYDGNTGASVTLSATPLSGDVVTISFASASFDNANVGAGKTVTVLGVAFGGGDGGNYSPTPVPVTTSASILAWSLAGYYQPVDMPAGGMVWNTVKGGSTVPLKFQIFVGSAERTDVGAVKAFTATVTTCGTPGSEDTVEITTTGGTELRYTGGQFIQNWQTPKSAGTCYRTTMTAQDGSLLTAYFKLK